MTDSPQRSTISLGSHALDVLRCGRGTPLLMIASLGRGGEDFVPLMRTLDSQRFHCIALDQRGVGNSGGELNNISLHDLANDCRDLLTALNCTPAHIIGHAFGNRVARCLAADHPDAVRSCTLLGAGGKIPADPDLQANFIAALKGELVDEDFHRAIRDAHFSAQSDSGCWRTGWWTNAARSQAKAARDTQRSDWWHGGDSPLLVIQGNDDRMAPPANGLAIKQEFGARVTLHTIADAGHALLLEQPEEIARLFSEYQA
ncbi:MAG TPA: alpha/beta hydrolase [Chromatiaceae bacterium]|nr:alpha/beta hydrolase [Chromatiaceae bacterium]